MKALTLQRPWGWAILYAGKDVENRSWPTKYRGPLFIHQGKALDPDAQHFRPLQEATRDLHPFGDTVINAAGFILGSVNVVGCHLWNAGCCASEWAVVGGWHWELAEPRRLAEPIAARGSLGLWGYDEASA